MNRPGNFVLRLGIVLDSANWTDLQKLAITRVQAQLQRRQVRLGNEALNKIGILFTAAHFIFTD